MLLACWILHLGLFALPAPQGAESEESLLDSILVQDQLTGDWGGKRSSLAERGLVIEAVLVQELYWTARGGLDQGLSNSRYAQLDFGFDLEKLLGVSGAAAFASGYHTEGGGVSSDVGDFQGVSNIEADQIDILGEFWWEQRLFDNGLRVKLGKLDANSEFAYTDVASEFIHSSMGFSPTIFPFPSFPFPAWGALAEAGVGDSFLLRVGVFDGALASGLDTGGSNPSFLGDHPTSAFWVAEGDVNWGREFPGRLGVGGWLHTEEFSRFDGGVDDDASGTYLVFDQRVWNGPGGRQVAVFSQAGFADESVSEVGLHLGAGVVHANSETGSLLGFGVSAVEFSSEAAAGFSEDYEVAFELFSRIELVPWLSLKPDLQYIVNPGGSSALDDALAIGIRLEWLL